MVTLLLSVGLPPVAASARPTCWPTDRRASCHGSKAPPERPPLVVDHGLSFWTTRSRRPLPVGLYRSRRRLSYGCSDRRRRCWWTRTVLFWPTSLTNTYRSDRRCWWTRAVLTNVADERVRIWPTLLKNTCCS